MIPEMKDKSRRKRERAAALAMVVCDRTAVKKSEVTVGHSKFSRKVDL